MPRPPQPEIPATFYRTATGADPIIDWLRSLPPEDRHVIGADLATVQFAWPIGMTALAWCTASLRRRKKHRPPTSTSPAGA
jgi:hypothetical protein